MKFFGMMLYVAAVLLVLTACQQSSPTSPTQPAVTNPTLPTEGDATGYPVGESVTTPGYPVEDGQFEDAVSEPPNPERSLPAADANVAVVGGVLIWQVDDDSFQPLEPLSLQLAEVLLTDTGQPAYVRSNENSPQAELFDTGIFIFNSVPPGSYGLMVDLGYTVFAINDESGDPLLIELEAGEVLDLGQIVTQTPGVGE